jgi:hypothetical protein
MKRLLVVLAVVGSACAESSPADPENAEGATPDTAVSSDDLRSEFLGMIGNDSWANWPAGLSEDPNDQGRSCFRVTEAMRQAAIDMLESQPATRLDEVQYKRLVGAVRPPGGGAPYLLRGFSSANSLSRSKWSGDAVVVHTDAPEGLSNVRRHPCVAILNRMPAAVFTVSAYEL